MISSKREAFIVLLIAFLVGFTTRSLLTDSDDNSSEEESYVEVATCEDNSAEIESLKNQLAMAREKIKTPKPASATCTPEKITIIEKEEVSPEHKEVVKKLNPELFDQEFREAKKTFQEKLKKELSKEIPRGEVVHRNTESDGSFEIVELTDDGSRISKYYDSEGVLEHLSWSSENGDHQFRRYNKNGDVAGLYVHKGRRAVLSVDYDDEGRMRSQSLISDKSGDVLRLRYDREGRISAKGRVTQSGHRLNIMEEKERR